MRFMRSFGVSKTPNTNPPQQETSGPMYVYTSPRSPNKKSRLESLQRSASRATLSRNKLDEAIELFGQFRPLNRALTV